MHWARVVVREVSQPRWKDTGRYGFPTRHRSKEAWRARSAFLDFKDRPAIKLTAKFSSWRVRFSSRRLTPLSDSALRSDASVATQPPCDLSRRSYRYQQATVRRRSFRSL